MIGKVLLGALFVGLCLANDYKKHLNYVRPCNLKDYKCIRDNMAVNSDCDMRVKGYVEEVYTLPQSRFETPYFNATYVDNNLRIYGQNRCFVSEFFVDTKKNTGVLGIDCPNLTFESNRTLYQHYPLKEDHIYSYKIIGTYPLIRLTTQITHMNQFDFCKAYTFAYVDQLPKFHIDANDKPTSKFLTTDLTHLNIFERETFAYRANGLARKFVDSLICSRMPSLLYVYYLYGHKASDLADKIGTNTVTRYRALIRLTTQITHMNQFDFCKAYTFAYVDQLPKFHIDANDKPTSKFLTTDLTHLNIFERETFAYRANGLARKFVDSLICNFGCEK